MRKAKKKDISKKRGRPATGRDPVTSIRLPPILTTKLDAWAARKGHSRSEAIRAMIEDRLARSRSNAHDVAGEHLDRHADPSASADEQGRRKKLLLKGPGEFRELIAEQRKRRKPKPTHTGL